MFCFGPIGIKRINDKSENCFKITKSENQKSLLVMIQGFGGLILIFGFDRSGPYSKNGSLRP